MDELGLFKGILVSAWCMQLSFLLFFTQAQSHTCCCLFLLLFPVFSWMLAKSISTPLPPSHPYAPPTSRPAISAKTTCCPKRTLCPTVPNSVKATWSHRLSPTDPSDCCLITWKKNTPEDRAELSKKEQSSIFEKVFSVRYEDGYLFHFCDRTKTC